MHPRATIGIPWWLLVSVDEASNSSTVMLAGLLFRGPAAWNLGLGYFLVGTESGSLGNPTIRLALVKRRSWVQGLGLNGITLTSTRFSPLFVTG